VAGVVWLALVAVGWVVAAVEPSGSNGEEASGGLIVLGWCGGIVTSLWIRRDHHGDVGVSSSEGVPWPQPTARSRQWPARFALAAYAGTFAGVVVLACVFYFGFGVHLRVGVGVLMVDAVLLSSLVPLSRKHGVSHADLGLRTVPARRVIGLGVLAFVIYVMIAVLWVIVVNPREGADALANVTHESTVNVVLTVFAVAVSAPVVEEVFFRGLLYRSLRNRLSVLPAVLIAGSMFGLVHITSYPLDTLPVKAAFGVIACLLYERTGSLLPGIALHSFVDASSIDVSLTGNDLIVLGSFLCLAAVLFVRGSRPSATVRGRAVPEISGLSR
jgi:uncharacterized protein